MNIGDLEPIRGDEKEFFQKGRKIRHVFEAGRNLELPNCPKCGHNKKVFAAAGKFVCQNSHEES